MNKDQGKGRAKEVAGKAEETAGKIIGNKEMETKGKIKKVIGKMQSGFGDIKNDIAKKGKSN